MKIVAVDDENVALSVVRKQLEFKDPSAEIITFTSANKALDYIKHNQVDVCLVDYRMPEMEGTEFIAKVKQFDKIIKMFILTGLTKNPAELYNENIDGYLIKPFNFRLFENLLTKKGARAYFEEEYGLKLA